MKVVMACSFALGLLFDVGYFDLLSLFTKTLRLNHMLTFTREIYCIVHVLSRSDRRLLIGIIFAKDF